MITKDFLLKLFDAANMQRWNDQIRPVDLRELDKQAHKMIIAFILGKYEEDRNRKSFSWIEIIEGGFFEFLQRIVVTDLKPQLFHKIKDDKVKYKQLNVWVCKQIEHVIKPLGNNLFERFQDYLFTDKENINRRILSAAHFYATKWEFNIVERVNPTGYEIAEIKSNITKKQEKYYDLNGIQQLALYSNLRNFIDLCGQLRFQIRWSHLHRIPKTSVLGHMLIVALLSYLCSLEINACTKRCVNNYFTGLFHDLPEVLTRDILAPIKCSVKGLDNLIKKYEKEEMAERVYKLIPKEWHSEIKMFTENEFYSVITQNGKLHKLSSKQINESYNKNRYNPKDGEIVRVCDHLAAFFEAYLAIENGMKSSDLVEAKKSLFDKYHNKEVAGIQFGKIYQECFQGE